MHVEYNSASNINNVSMLALSYEMWTGTNTQTSNLKKLGYGDTMCIKFLTYIFTNKFF